MMKNFFFIILMCFASFSVYAQKADNSNTKFMKRFAKLIERIDKCDGECNDSIAVWKTERKSIATLYKERYREVLDDDQLEEYASLSAQYNSRITEIRLGGLSEEIDSLGNRVGRGMRRAGKKVSGFIEGVKKQSEKNRNKK